ncbi:MAG TPA: Wzz/FepE/Etk N-terminal domain-containing protein [Bacteroidales bacterium]|nr:Wzz/FepE/Etk N-terminal domain-containing protein [Bacteroidales bacterium]
MHDPKPPEMHAFSLVNLSLKHRKTLLIIGLATLALSYLFTSPWFITPLYKSTVILYPTSTNSISKVLLNNNFSGNKDLLEFGEDQQTERMLQILNSNKIRDRIIEKYNLIDHYNISRGNKYRLTRLFETYESRVRFRRTEYMAVKITVLDHDPLIASQMANDIAELFDSTMNAMQKEVAVRAFRIVENEYLNLRNQVMQLEDSLNTIRRLGVHDYESQAEMINQQLAIEIARNNQQGIKALYEKLDLLSKYGGIYVSLRDMLEHERKQLSQIKARYEEAKVDATQNLPHKFVVSSAFPAERKSYPIRWLVALIAVVSALFLALIMLILIEQTTRSEKKKFHSNSSIKSLNASGTT